MCVFRCVWVVGGVCVCGWCVWVGGGCGWYILCARVLVQVEETAARDNDRVQLLSEDGDLSITMVKVSHLCQSACQQWLCEAVADLWWPMQVKARPEVVDDSFSLCMALDEGFFSDISFKCSDRVFLQAHRVVLEAAYPSLAVREWQVLLEAQSSSLGRLLLACVYSDCLPVDVTVPQAQSLMSCLSRQSKLTRLQQFCTAFIEANNLKKSECVLTCNTK